MLCLRKSMCVIDVDECLTRPCGHNCANVYGSYQCYCHHGYQLSNIDRVTCEGRDDCRGLRSPRKLHVIAPTAGFCFLSDIDECALPSGGHTCSYHCSNVPGGYYCTCPPTGYILGPNGHTCLGLWTSRRRLSVN